MTAKGHPAKRGRPPKISFDDVIESAIEQLRLTPDQPLSMNALAKSLNVTPMALYRHVHDRDHLLQFVAHRLLDELKPQLPDADWSEQLHVWAASVREHFLANPGLFSILGWHEHIASAWWRQLATLARILKSAGFTKYDLADAVQWVGNAVMSAIYLEIAGQRSGYRLNHTDWQNLSGDDFIVVSELNEYLSAKSARSAFIETVERIIINLTMSRVDDRSAV